MFKKVITLLLVVVLTASAAIAGTVAYLQDTDEDVNVMTLGNVKIEQHEYERVVGADGNYTTIDVDGTTSYELKDFTQGKPLYPFVGEVNNGYDTTEVRLAQLGHNSRGGMSVLPAANVQDKFVVVENTGKSDAYVRTIVALEAGSVSYDDWWDVINYSYHFTWNENRLESVVNIDGNNYVVVEFLYKGYEDIQHPNGVLTPGDYTYNSLAQVYMFNTATNEDVEAIDGNGNGRFDILVLSQAVQTAGFATAQTALDTAFGDVTAENVAQWFGDMKIPGKGEPALSYDDRVEYKGVIYDSLAAAVAAANANGGGNINLKGSTSISETLPISSNITLNGNGHQLSRADGFTGTILNVAAGAALTTENVTIDGGGKNGVTATGNLIAATGSAPITLNAGTVLQNNVGSHAVNLGTRIGATLTLNGAQIINNSSDSGAIWGGGHITVNEGSKISYNSSTGSAGAIRMVSNCNLTMNGGEISHNKAAADGGAIWGYGSSTYNFNGGEISNNESAGTGGAIYTGTYSVINISGNFEMCDNKAASAGAIRLTDHTSLNMTDGKISGNKSTGNEAWDGFYGWDAYVAFAGGTLNDDVTIQTGLTPTVGKVDGDGVIHFAVKANHNTVNLEKEFGTIRFTVAEGANFAAFNFKPAAGYTYTAGDEAKLQCMNEDYETYWDSTTGTFRLKLK